MRINFQNFSFYQSAAKLSQLPQDEATEIAFCGRSNAGKSTMLNILCKQKNLARTSATPGRTQLINIFSHPKANLRLIDLPGYGFAKAPVKVKKQWEALVSEFLRHRAQLRGIVFLMDIRHPLQQNDFVLLNWIIETQTPCRLALSKADKISKNKQKAALLNLQQKLQEHQNFISVQIFSATKKIGTLELHDWLEAQTDLIKKESL